MSENIMEWGANPEATLSFDTYRMLVRSAERYAPLAGQSFDRDLDDLDEYLPELIEDYGPTHKAFHNFGLGFLESHIDKSTELVEDFAYAYAYLFILNKTASNG